MLPSWALYFLSTCLHVEGACFTSTLFMGIILNGKAYLLSVQSIGYTHFLSRSSEHRRIIERMTDDEYLY